MDREKVIKQLEKDAIATDTGYVEVPLWLFSEILALLKEQEHKDKMYHALEDDWKRLKELLKEREAENGEWITIWQEDDPDTSIHARCSICNRISERPLGGYCKWCGAKMNQEWGVDG